MRSFGPFVVNGPLHLPRFLTLGVFELPESPKSVAVLIGGLRRDSINRYLFNAIQELAPLGISFVEARIGDLPLCNADLEIDGPPAPVSVFRDQIRASDGLLVITPEYNYSIPGVLKTAIDWLWAPSTIWAAYGKPGAMMDATGGRSRHYARSDAPTQYLRDLEHPRPDQT